MSAFFRSVWLVAVERECDAHTGADHHLMLLTSNGPLRASTRRVASQRPSSGWYRCRMTNSSPPMRATVSSARTHSQPTGHSFQQRVANCVPECIVDLLEAIKIKAQHRYPLFTGERLLQALGQQYAIGQFGERIMVCHVGDLRFVSMALGEVADGIDLVAAQSRAERLADDLDRDGFP